ncbi:MAG: DUF58 domain-containing protein [Myxococcales bacterium]|nr:DUF58 domain-containing protein [Myxococcota bacterium]MDW8280791.1 DUF58 domain-containing protein [Myxococcales bacterium]
MRVSAAGCSSHLSPLPPTGGARAGPGAEPALSHEEGTRRAGPIRLRHLLLPRRLRFTREGWWFCAMTLGIGFSAMNTGNNLLYLLLGMLLSIIIASGVLSEMSLRGLSVRRLPPLRAHANQPFLMGISLCNTKRYLPSFSIEVEDLCGEHMLDKKCYFLKIPSGRMQQTSYRHTLPRRGLYIFTALRISTKFPFALFRKSRLVEHRSELVVFPELVPLCHLPASLTRAIGELSHTRRGRCGLFYGIREYRTGDDPRDIHWRSSARRGRLVVREYEDEAIRQVALYVDNGLDEKDRNNEILISQIEKIISWAASLAAFYLEHGYAIRLCARGEGAAVPLCVGLHMLGRVLTFLALLPTVPTDTPFSVPHALYRGREEALLLVPSGRSREADPRLGRVVEVA